MPWLFLFIASLFEVCWAYSLKSIDIQRIRDIAWGQLLAQPSVLVPLIPILGYVGFGVFNTTFLSLAMRHIPTATAYASWMALAVVGIRICDIFLFKQPFSWLHVFFTSLIVLGVIGLRRLP